MSIVWILYHIHHSGDFLGSVFMMDNLHADETTLVVFNTKEEERTNRNPAIEVDVSSIQNATSRGDRAGGAGDQDRLTVDMDTLALQLESKNERNTEERQRQSLEQNDSKNGRDNENNQVEPSSRAEGTMKNGSSSLTQDTNFQQISNFTGDENNKMPTLRQHKATNKFAYVYVLAGVDPESIMKAGNLYSVLVSNEFIRMVNSIADVVVLIRLHKDSNATRLKPDQEHLLQQEGIKVKYLPGPPRVDNFFTAVMEKFRILDLTEYNRVIYLDLDTLPMCNLDYLFVNSVGPNPILRENVIHIGPGEPAQGGFFMLEPNHQDANRIMDIINERYKVGVKCKKEDGWGHKILPPDHWDSIGHQNQTKYDFYAACADQGLLYHWTKYVKKSVSIMHPEFIENYGTLSEVTNGSNYINASTMSMLSRFGWEALKQNKINGQPQKRSNLWSYDDIKHFSGRGKPWRENMTKLEWLGNVTRGDNKFIINGSTPSQQVFEEATCTASKADATRLWFELLVRVVSRLKLDINITEFQFVDSSLGFAFVARQLKTSRGHFHPRWFGD